MRRVTAPVSDVVFEEPRPAKFNLEVDVDYKERERKENENNVSMLLEPFERVPLKF